MGRLINYNRGESVAIGIVKPKTTALFFDKIWIPNSIFGNEYGLEKYFRKGYLEIPDTVRVFEANVNNILEGTCYENYFRHILANHPFTKIEDVIGEIEFKYSSHRNMAIHRATAKFWQFYSIDAVPIYFNHTEYEEGMNMLSNHDIFFDPPIIKRKIMDICINNIPLINEDELEWNQILEIRQDKDSHKKMKKFRDWIDFGLEDLSKDEFNYSFNKAYDEYCLLLKKHGIKTFVGGFSALLNLSSNFMEMAMQDNYEKVISGIGISVMLINYTVGQYLEYLDIKKEPIAYIYDVLNKIK